MKIEIQTGDVLQTPADVLVSTANPWLDMSGGVNGAIRMQCPEIQEELKAHLVDRQLKAVPAGTVIKTSSGELPFHMILHAVSIDPFYSTSQQIINDVLSSICTQVTKQGLRTIAMPTLATGYGQLPMNQFADWFFQWLHDSHGERVPQITLVAHKPHDVDLLRSYL